jgi:hypothetical protein
MPNQTHLFNLLNILQGGAPSRTSGPYQNEKSMFANPVITPKPLSSAHPIAHPPTPLPRPAQGGGGIGGNVPVPIPRPQGGPYGAYQGMPTAESFGGLYKPRDDIPTSTGSGPTGTPPYQGSPDPMSQAYQYRGNTDIPSPALPRVAVQKSGRIGSPPPQAAFDYDRFGPSPKTARIGSPDAQVAGGFDQDRFSPWPKTSRVGSPPGAQGGLISMLMQMFGGG